MCFYRKQKVSIEPQIVWITKDVNHNSIKLEKDRSQGKNIIGKYEIVEIVSPRRTLT